MNNIELTDPKYDECRYWIETKKKKKYSFDQIRLACGTDQQNLKVFLKMKSDYDDWPYLTVQDWNDLVDAAQNEEKKRLKEQEASKAASLQDTDQVSDLEIPSSPYSCWQLYRKHLLYDSHFALSAVDNIEESCLGIMQRIRNKTEKKHPIKGLVIGNVQSGKTANMAGLMAMAADYGWNFFIVLSGTIENLRKQTQNRLYNDLNTPGNLSWTQFDHLKKGEDVPQNVLSNLHLEDESKERYLTVCLKNKKRLNDLLEWLHSDPNQTSKLKILLIDDEADQASINTGDVTDDAERKAINKAILNIVQCRDKNAQNDEDNKFTGHYAAMNYISYTATPYANCLNETDENSLYPRNFIRTLPLSDEYIGPKQIFGGTDDVEGETLNIVRDIPENDRQQVKALNEGSTHELPRSLKDSVLWFICAAAIMRYEDYEKPVSMLIHTSQKQNEHKAVADALVNWFNANHKNFVSMCQIIYERETNLFTKTDFRNVYKNYGIPDNEIWDYPDYEELKDYISELSERMDFIKMDSDDELKYTRHIHLCIDNCLNNKIDDEGNHFRLAYPDKAKGKMPDYSTAFIVIGGNTLSRGLTLEGLVSTYFLRTVKQADTLMQMGRWFGYRRHYELLPRVWMTEETKRKFEFLTDIDEDLRQNISDMAMMGKTPLQFSPVIRNSPKMSWMRLTARNKSQMAEEADIDYSGTDTQLTVYSRNASDEEYNIEITEMFIDSFDGWKKSEINDSYFIKGVSFETIKENFLKKFKVPSTSTNMRNIEAFCEWEEEREKNLALDKWSVVVGSVSKKDKTDSGKWNLNDFSVRKVVRTAKGNENSENLNIGVLSNKMDYLADLNKIDIPSEAWEMKSNVSTEYGKIRAASKAEKIPLLVIYRIDRNSKPRANTGVHSTRHPLNTPEDLIGFSMVMPGEKTGKNYVHAKLYASENDGKSDLD